MPWPVKLNFNMNTPTSFVIIVLVEYELLNYLPFQSSYVYTQCSVWLVLINY